jgi:hypothetical protein
VVQDRVKRKFAAALLAGALSSCALPPALAQAAAVRWKGVDRVVAFADVHGAYAQMLALLRDTGIVDAQDRWAAGRTHLVSLGDLLDRGADSRKALDLLMRLQGEALAQGGQVHVVLGNHETMNLLGDLRYVDPGEYASYADLESGTERARLRQDWETTHGAGSGTEFDRKFPPGYFGHRAAFSSDGKYGRWLLSLPVAIVIDDTLFMHAGPSKVLAGMSLEEVNLRYRTALADYLGLAGQLGQAKLLQPDDEYNARPRLAKERLTAGATADAAPDAELLAATQRFESAAGSDMISEDGPNWYRGPALCNEAAESDTLLPLLQQFAVSRLVVGHTPTRSSRVQTRFDGRVVKLDTGMNPAAYKGRASALIVEPSGISVRYAGEAGAASPQPEGLRSAPDRFDEASVLAALRDGEVAVTGPRGPNEMDVNVTHEGRQVPAVFQVRGKAPARKEVAAYLLDRRLGLGIVPVTVEREVQGQRGVLQGRPPKWVTQAQVQQQSLRGGGWCDAEPQFQLVYAFDTLIGNEGRTADALLFDSDDWFVYVTAHDRAFATTSGLPAYLKARPPTPGAEIRRRAAALDEASLQAALGELLSAREIRAILLRRDALLALSQAGAAR